MTWLNRAEGIFLALSNHFSGVSTLVRPLRPGTLTWILVLSSLEINHAAIMFERYAALICQGSNHSNYDVFAVGDDSRILSSLFFD